MLKARERLTPGPYLRFHHFQKKARISSRKTTNAFRTMIALSIKAPIRFSINGVREKLRLLLHSLLRSYIPLLDDDVLTPARAPVNGTTRTTGQDFKDVHARRQGKNFTELTP